jgi:aminopeptidase N
MSTLMQWHAALARHARTSFRLGVVCVGISLCAGVTAAAEGPAATDAIPKEYRIALTVDPSKPGFSGHVEIDVNLPKPLQLIRINGRKLAVSHVAIRQGTSSVEGTYSEVDEAGEAQIELPRFLSKGAATVSFDYDAPFQEVRAGLFRGNVAGQWFVLSYFVPTNARRAFPSFDHINLKVPYTVTLIAPAGMLAVSNMPEVSQQPENDSVRHVFAKSPPLPTYLVGFSVGPFASLDGTIAPTAARSRPIPLRVLLPPAQIGQAKFALDNTARIIRLLEDLYGLAYPFPKLDMIGLPLMKGGMENAGAPIFGDDILTPGDHASPAQYRFFGSLVAHELSHQWFGNMVTPTWWNDIWIKESFAQETGSIIASEWQPDLDFTTSLRKSAFTEMEEDALPGQLTLHKDLREREAASAYQFAYGKGSQVLAMADGYLGRKRYRQGVHHFLATHAYGSATTHDLYDALAAAGADARFSTALQSFTDQPGVPLLSLLRTGRTLRITQSRYTPIGMSVPPQQWTIPFCYRQGAAKTCKLLTEQTTQITLANDSPVMPNADGVGYYRFEMSDADWSALIAAASQFPGGESLAVSDSLWAAFAAGHVAPSRLVDAMDTLSSNPIPDAALDGGQRWLNLRDRGLVADTAAPGYRAMLATAYGRHLREIGFDPRSGAYGQDDIVRQRLRAGLVNIMALGAGDPEVVAALQHATDRFLAGDETALGTAFRLTAFTLRARTGGPAGAESLLKRAIASSDGSVRPAIVVALGSSDDPEVARALLSRIGNTGLRVPDEADLFLTMFRYARTQEVALAWLEANYERLSSTDMGVMLEPGMGARLCSQGDAARFDKVMRAHAIRTGKAGTLDGTLEAIRSCDRLKAAKQSDISATLSKSERRVP